MSLGARPRAASRAKPNGPRRRRHCVNNDAQEPAKLSCNATVHKSNSATSTVRTARANARAAGARTVPDTPS
eukprot:4138874-Lingulodinium_polyedra.AAC.1